MFYKADEEWTEMISDYRKRISAIKIPKDVNTNHAKVILSDLDSLYGEIRLMYGDVKKQLDEAENLVERVRRKAESHGNNVELRKANGISAVEKVTLRDGTEINLYDIRIQLNHQKEDLDGLLSVINNKSSMVITVNGLLKIESTIAGH